MREKGWEFPRAQGHVLGNLHGKNLGLYKLLLLIGAKNRFGATYFQIFLQNADGEVSQQPVIIGLHNEGKYPGYNWIEIVNLSQRIKFASGTEVSLDGSSRGLAQQLLKYLADLLPPGGHMMVEYDSPGQQDTARSLAIGIPPVATPLGYMLFSAGCRAGFKDWYFAEGGAEGTRKLQGYKALDEQHAKIKARELVQELRAFLSQLPASADSGLEIAARDRALDILAQLGQ